MKEGWEEDRFNGLIVEKEKKERKVQRREAVEKTVQRRRKE